MTGRRYYITTLADWHRHAHRFANSHWLALVAPKAGDANPKAEASNISTVGARHVVPEGADSTADPSSRELAHTTRIVVLVDADEGVHLALDDDATFEALPHPFAPKPISHAAHEALAAHGIAPGSTAFDAAEAVARAHPLLRPRVF